MNECSHDIMKRNSKSLDEFVEFMELAAHYKREYYKTRPIMSILRAIGVERGVNSRSTRWGMYMADKVLRERVSK